MIVDAAAAIARERLLARRSSLGKRRRVIVDNKRSKPVGVRTSGASKRQTMKRPPVTVASVLGRRARPAPGRNVRMYSQADHNRRWDDNLAYVQAAIARTRERDRATRHLERGVRHPPGA